MIINLSRIGKQGTGMWQFSDKFIDSVNSEKKIDAIICSKPLKNNLSKYNCEIITVPEFVSNTSNVSRLRPILWFLYSYWLGLKLFIVKNGIDVVSTTHHVLPFIKNQIVTIHDLRPFYFPDSKLQKIYFHFFLPKALKKCKHILTVSNSVKDKINDIYGYNSDKISVIYNSIDTSKFTPKEAKKNYILAVGASWEHKNVDSLLNVSAIWKNKYNLIIVCGNTKYSEFLRGEVLRLGLNDNVKFLNNISESKLIDLYQYSSALIYPSKDEGFGIPPVESLACLSPVIVSDIPVFHEVLDDVAIYVNPYDTCSWKKAFDKISIQNSNEQWKKKALECACKYNKTLMASMIHTWLLRMEK